MTKNKSIIFIVLVLGFLTSLGFYLVKNRLGTISRVMTMSTGMGGMPNTSQKQIAVMPEELATDEAVYSSPTADVGMGRTSEVEIMPYYPSYPGDALNVENRVYEKYSDHQVVVKDVSIYLKNLKDYILGINGKVLNSNVSTSSQYKYAYLYAKVPVEKFDEVTAKIVENTKEVVGENIQTSDVTGQAVSTDETVTSIEEQLELKKVELAEAKTDLDKKKIELEIKRLENRLEAAKKSQENMNERVTYATINVTASDNKRFFNPSSPISSDPGEQLERAWESVSVVLMAILGIAIWTGVYAIIWLPLVLIIVLIKNLVSKKK